MISERVKNTQPPPLVSMGQLVSQQSDCISLGQGAPFYHPPSDLFTRIYAELSKNTIHRYTADPGLPELRSAIVDKLRMDQQVNTEPDQIVITPGANQAFYNVLITITDPGDEIILLSPYYFNHLMAATSVNVVPIVVSLKSDFSFDIEKITQSITDKTKAIVVVNPGNPTGIVHQEQEIRELIKLASENSIVIIADETYEYFVYRDKHIPIASLTDNVISISSFSKTFGIPGWRLGYYIAKNEVVKESLKVQDTIGICAPHISQLLGIELINQRKSIISEFVELMKNNFKLARDLLEEISWLESSPAGGAYYLFPHQTTGENTEQLIIKLIREYGVYIVPGSGFGETWNNNCRISFANVDEEQLKQAFSRLRAYS